MAQFIVGQIGTQIFIAMVYYFIFKCLEYLGERNFNFSCYNQLWDTLLVIKMLHF